MSWEIETYSRDRIVELLYREGDEIYLLTISAENPRFSIETTNSENHGYGLMGVRKALGCLKIPEPNNLEEIWEMFSQNRPASIFS